MSVLAVMAVWNIILLSISFVCLSYLEFPPYQVYFICAAITLSNLGIYAVFVQFEMSCQYIGRRFETVNVLLRQMLFHQPLLDYCYLIENKSPKRVKKLQREMASTIFDPNHTTYLNHSGYVKTRSSLLKPYAIQETMPKNPPRVLSEKEIEDFVANTKVKVLKTMYAEQV